MAKENLAQDLSDFLATKNYQVRYTDENGKDSSPEQAKVFAFDWTTSSNKNYGTAVIVLGDEDNLQLYYGDNLGKSIDNAQDKEEWFAFMKQVKDFSTRHNIGTFTPMDINQLKHTMAGMAAIKEGLFEGYYGTRRVSYMGEQTDARLVIKHNRVLGENDKRYRYVESLFIETTDGERFKLPFTKLAGGRAMLEHVKQGGTPYDIRGQHIKSMVQEMNVLARFNRASQQKIFEGATAQLVEEARHYYAEIKQNLTHLATQRGYREYFESWSPADIGSEDALVEDIKQMFIEQTIDARIEAAVPILARLQQGATMKEVTVFENWVNRMAEGTWALPDNPEAQEKLNNLMKQELIVGPDATNATENLYDVIGDDDLFDILSDLAERDPRANIWDDSDVQARLAELGIQTPQSTETEPADIDQDTAPTEPEPTTEAEQTDGEQASRKIQTPAYLRKAKGDDWRTSTRDLETARERTHSSPEGLRALTQRLGLGEDQELRRIRELAKLPVKESVLTDSTGHTLDHILARFGKEYRDWQQTGNLEGDFYEALYDYYFDDMPYGTKKARTGDPYEWISDRLARDRGLNEADPMDTFEMGVMGPAMGGQMVGVGEAKSCNMTAEGEYCPEHGLAECGYMESMGSTVAGGMGPVIGVLEADAPALSVQQLAMISDEALDNAYHYGRSNPGNTFGWQANLMSASYAKKAIESGITDIEQISDAIHKGWNVTAQKFVANPDQFDDTEKLRQAGKLDAKLQQRANLMKVDYANLSDEEKEKDRVVARALLKALKGDTAVSEAPNDAINYNAAMTGSYYESDDPLARIRKLALNK